MRWFRMYNELIDDPKVDKMSDKTFKFFVFTMCLASEENQDGYIKLTEKDISWRLRMRPKTIKTAIKELIDLSILSNNNGDLQLINWNKRQFKSDDINVRVKRYRKRYTETLHETAPEQNRTDTEQKPPPLNVKFTEFWNLYPKKKSKGKAEKIWKRINPNDGVHSNIMAGLNRAIKFEDWLKDNGKFIPYPGTWLNDKGWEDEAAQQQSQEQEQYAQKYPRYGSKEWKERYPEE